MKRMAWLVGVMMLAILVSGCGSATSPFVGQWQADELPGPLGEAVERANLNVAEDGTFKVVLEGGGDGTQRMGVVDGRWEAVDAQQVRFVLTSGDVEQAVRGVLEDADTLVVQAEEGGEPVRFRRVE
ncbi:MAG: hypothetical protein WDZ31_04635 [Phycisphaeraceae bacterium]